jgi:hypothetical protein
MTTDCLYRPYLTAHSALLSALHVRLALPPLSSQVPEPWLPAALFSSWLAATVALLALLLAFERLAGRRKCADCPCEPTVLVRNPITLVQVRLVVRLHSTRAVVAIAEANASATSRSERGRQDAMSGMPPSAEPDAQGLRGERHVSGAPWGPQLEAARDSPVECTAVKAPAGERPGSGRGHRSSGGS